MFSVQRVENEQSVVRIEYITIRALRYVSCLSDEIEGEIQV